MHAFPLALPIAAHIGIASTVTIVLTLVIQALIRRSLGVRGQAKDWRERVLLRYQTRLGPLPWVAIPPFMFARFKLRLDPMFEELPKLIGRDRPPGVALDVGCGFGVAGCALEEWFPGTRIAGIEPGRFRSNAARRVLSDATIIRGLAPHALADLPDATFDVVLMLDVTHLIPQASIERTLRDIRARIPPDGQLIARVNVPQPGGQSIIWHVDWFHRLITNARTYHRPLEATHALIESAGFEITHSEISGGKPEMVWLVASPASTTHSAAESVPHDRRHSTSA